MSGDLAYRPGDLAQLRERLGMPPIDVVANHNQQPEPPVASGTPNQSTSSPLSVRIERPGGVVVKANGTNTAVMRLLQVLGSEQGGVAVATADSLPVYIPSYPKEVQEAVVASDTVAPLSSETTVNANEAAELDAMVAAVTLLRSRKAVEKYIDRLYKKAPQVVAPLLARIAVIRAATESTSAITSASQPLSQSKVQPDNKSSTEQHRHVKRGGVSLPKRLFVYAIAASVTAVGVYPLAHTAGAKMLDEQCTHATGVNPIRTSLCYGAAAVQGVLKK